MRSIFLPYSNPMSSPNKPSKSFVSSNTHFPSPSFRKKAKYERRDRTEEEMRNQDLIP